MCGIVGIIRFDNKAVDHKDIEVLNDSLAHRGPDNKGCWYSAARTIALGHRRLSILDLSQEANQPMSYRDRYWITYNGEIFNYIEIREELKTLGYTFKTNSDTEMILAAYDCWGHGMLNRFNGMWAFAIYDNASNELMISRDRFGVKPLYYYRTLNRLVFASEVQAIHSLLGNRHPLEKMVMEHIANGGCHHFGTELTYLKNVKSLPGGYLLEVKKKHLVKKQWYYFKKKPVMKSFQKQAQSLKSLLLDAIQIRLRSDVPVGTCLSGGVDSGSITSAIREMELNRTELPQNFTHRGFCSSFPGTPIDESEKARELATLKNIRLDIVITDCPSEAELEQAMSQYDGPMYALAFYPIWKLYQYIRSQNIIVTLDGQGPDEMLGGYQLIFEALEDSWKQLDLFRMIDLYKTYSSIGETKQFSSKKFSRNALKNLIVNRIKEIPGKISIWSGLRKPAEISAVRSKSLPDLFIYPCPDYLKVLDRSLFNQFFNSPLPSILQQYDRCSMANSVECRMPFMDYRVIEFIFSLPSKSKIGNGYTKRVLREAVKEILPDEIRLNKIKIGFNAPIVDWFRGPLKAWMLNQMNQSEFLENQFFNGRLIRENFNRFIQSETPQWIEAWQFWGPVHIAWWMRRHRIPNDCYA
jgi:asparagine synthase (glutamine-hydrolysing)